MTKTTVRTRIAPSPTGSLHVGTARSALFSELFAHQHGGQFIVRIEDTDKERSRPEFEKDILEGLRWLGITWDEGPDKDGSYGPYRQSEREEHYTKALKDLLDKGVAYKDGESEAIRLRVEPQTVTFHDLIRGDVAIHTDTWGGDFVIARSLTDPVFHLAVVVDDAAMEISHVIRGEDHLTNTARHILLGQALGYEIPMYAHLPLLLDEKRRKLSKRAGDVALLSFRDAGYLPEAMLNYLALLGWNPKDDHEIFSHEDLLQRFTLEHVQKSGAIFSPTKLDSLNKHYLRELSADELLTVGEPFLVAAGVTIDNRAYWAGAVATEQERIATLAELPAAVSFFKEPWASDYPTEQLVWRKSTPEATAEYIEEAISFLSAFEDSSYTEENLTEKIMVWLDGRSWGRGDVLWPLRVAVTGREHSPSFFAVAAVLGKDTTLARLNEALAKLRAS